MTKPAGSRLGFAALALVAGLAVWAGLSSAMQATDQAAFCGGCHVMAEAAWTHKSSTHAKLACNECHAPANLAEKLPFKAVSGAQDVSANLAKHWADVIHAEKKHKDVINANCRRCHAVTVNTVNMEVKPYCVDCHRSIPHKSRTPISTRKVADG